VTEIRTLVSKTITQKDMLYLYSLSLKTRRTWEEIEEEELLEDGVDGESWSSNDPLKVETS
jgi:hypothetical protein